MLSNIIRFSLGNKLIILIFTFFIIVLGTYSLFKIPIGAVPDITNNQVQVLTTTRDLSTQDVEQFITHPIELEMRNLPGVKEIRSISKFGLSVVTIVFEDQLGTYLPRQLIQEKIEAAAKHIPSGFGRPELGPISTGLGEIYQYVLEVDPAYDDQYTAMDLRTIQDWIVKRQLAGIPGVVEINTWGGFLKQYEVSLNPDRLRAMDLAVNDIFEALNRNNSVAGGGYIEKDNQAYFIRGEGMIQSLEDINQIIVENRNGLPIYIKDVAEVGFGHATRFGAITGNGQGEKVMGQVMMLKDANSLQVIEAVKARVESIQATLPPGITINPFLERSELIGKTTATIAENLIYGCLIVILVVVLLLGNLRTGLVVASVIPLSLLFALSLMYLTGVDANLMSLGAIDFGIIIDGAVIIVEYIAFQIMAQRNQLQQLPTKARRRLLDDITQTSTHKMMHSAVFGQLIIILVFIPVLSLVNVEGKMFRPMALSFCFALMGAMILCFTYIPVVASIFLRPPKKEGNNWSGVLIKALQNAYRPILSWALGKSRLVIAGAMALMAGALFLFSTLGAEFVPTLDEGDFVIQPVLPTGTSLSHTVSVVTEIEKVVKEFPEVDQVVTRIGAAEVPTDPMSMEETDVIITLHPKRSWAPGLTKDGLADAIKARLIEAIPGVDYEFTQPIEMRFNELITGVRADLAVKIFGEDLSLLSEKADEIAALIQPVPGASDIIVEKIEGLPQMQVQYDREKIARYGLNVADLNDLISMGFAGKVAGNVFEGERRFDLVVRFDQAYRTDLENLQNAYVHTAGHLQVPLHELAEISYSTGPAKISRDNSQRRIVVSINVRDRDLESVVEDVRALIDEQVDLPPGYLVTYGGQFENLQNARQRLSYAVPVALALIFIMLYFAFRSLREALMIFSAIPMAAVGGVLFLWLRNMPFSISAGVGFIALFGIAVLNGIVLIAQYKQLKSEGMTDLKSLITQGTLSRLRPVLLTASAAAMGFLPMAVSTSAGAEVQRPLATVVIGGLITATFLTLVVLPVLYQWMTSRKKHSFLPKMLLLLGLCLPAMAHGQEKKLSLEESIVIAQTNNARLNAQRLEVKKAESLRGAAFNPSSTQLYYNYDQNNIARNDQPVKVWGIQQSFKFPTIYSKQARLQQALVELEAEQLDLENHRLVAQVTKEFYQVQHWLHLLDQYQFLDSVYARFSSAANRRVELGESNLIEKLTAESKHNEVKLKLEQVEKELLIARTALQGIMQTSWLPELEKLKALKVPMQTMELPSHPQVQVLEQQQQVTVKHNSLLSQFWLPDIQLEYFRGTNNGPEAEIYSGVQFGLGIPIFHRAQKSKLRAGKLVQDQQALLLQDFQRQLSARHSRLQLNVEKLGQSLAYYEQTGRELALSLIKAANLAFEKGEVDFFQYLQTIDRGVQIHIQYLTDMNAYNQFVISLNHLIN